MHEVKCPQCQEVREVAAKKPWMQGLPPYIKVCKKCVRKGVPKTEEEKRKLSESVKKAQTPELLANKSKYWKEHPELWKNLKPELGPISRIGTHHTDEVKKKISESTIGRNKSEEIKAKISEGMKKFKKEQKNEHE